MGYFFWLILFVVIVLVTLYSLAHERRRDFERRMSVGIERAHRIFDDTSRRFSEIRLTSIPETLRRRFSQGNAVAWDDRPCSSARTAQEIDPSGPEKIEHIFTEPEVGQCLATSRSESLDVSESGDRTSPQLDNESKTKQTEADQETQAQARVIGTFLKPIPEDDDSQTVHHESDPTTCDLLSVPTAFHGVIKNVEVCGETKEKKIVPTGSVIPMIKLDTCPTEESAVQSSSRAVSFVSSDEVIGPVSTYTTVSPRRMSLKPGNVPFVQKRGSVLLPATTVSPSVRRHSLLVPQQGYVCPRRTSVLFASDIFAHSPRRKSSTCGRNLHIPEQTVPTQSKRFFLPRKSVIKNVIRSSWSAVKGSSSGTSNLRAGIRATTSCTGSYYPHRRRSSLGFSTEDTASQSTADGLASKLPSLREIGGSIARRKSTLKKMISAPFQGQAHAESTKNERSQRRRESRACLSYFRRQSMFGRRQSTHIPKQKGNYLTGNLTEFKTVFGPNAHEVLTERFRKHGPLYEITALGQKTVFLFDHKDIEQVKKAEGKYPKHMDFKHLRLYRQRNDLPMGMLLSNGEEWRQQRKFMAKILLGAVQMTRYVPVINKVADSIIEIVSKNLPEDGVFLPEEDIGNYVIEAFGRILYGRDLHCLETGQMNELHQFVKTAKSNFNDAKKLLILPTCLMLLHPAWRRQNERWNSLLETTVHQVRLSNDPGQKRNSFCVLSQIFAGGEMTEPEILVNLTDLLMASIDTTSNVILWSLYELSCHPGAQDKIVEEFKQLNCSSSAVKFQDLRELVYLKAVVKESLRLHPVGFLTCRTISKPVSVRQYSIPQKATVAAAMYVMGRNTDLTYDADSFIPERWLMNDPHLESFYNTVPFGFGPRACLGRRVAEVEISLFLLHFCLQFRFRMKTSETIGHTIKLLLVPSRTLELILENRFN